MPWPQALAPSLGQRLGSGLGQVHSNGSRWADRSTQQALPAQLAQLHLTNRAHHARTQRNIIVVTAAKRSSRRSMQPHRGSLPGWTKLQCNARQPPAAFLERAGAASTVVGSDIFVFAGRRCLHAWIARAHAARRRLGCLPATPWCWRWSPASPQAPSIPAAPRFWATRCATARRGCAGSRCRRRRRSSREPTRRPRRSTARSGCWAGPTRPFPLATCTYSTPGRGSGGRPCCGARARQPAAWSCMALARSFMPDVPDAR